MGTENQQSGGGGDLGSLAAANGVTLGMSGGYSGDLDDFEVIVKRGVTPQRSVGRAVGDLAYQEPGQPMPTLKRRSELEPELYAKKPGDVAELQRRLWAGGFYPPGANPDEIALGDYDEYTYKAWQNAIERAGRFRAAKQEYTLDEVIDMGANIRGGSGLGGDGAGGSGRAPLVTELANPEDLKYYAQRTAVATLGRALRPEELSRFVSSFHGSQQAAQAQAYNAAGGAGGQVVGAPSPAAAAETFARQAAPTEAGAHDFVKVYDVFSKMLGGRRQ